MQPEIVLMTGKPCASCEEAERVWRAVAEDLGVRLVVHDVDLGEGPGVAPPVGALPALLVDGETIVVGVPEPDGARRCLRDALARREA